VALGESNQDRPDNSRELDPLLSNETGARVIRFTPREGGSRVNRGAERFIGNADPDPSPVPDLGRYQGRESSDEYRHRMMVNAVAFAFTSLLVVAGVWLAMMMSPA
jgi:hypothetical protein